MKKVLICWPRPEGEDLVEYFEGAQETSSAKAKQQFHHDKDLYAVPSFYTKLEKVLDDMGVPHDRLYGKRYRKVSAPNKDTIVLCYHAHTDNIENNVWFVHTSSLAGHFTLDRRGYAGFSEVAHNSSFFQKSQGVDLDKAREFFDSFSTSFIESNTSRNYQPDTQLNVDEPYVFVAGQLSYDSVVTQLSNIANPQSYYDTIARDIGCKVVFKKHPAQDVNGKGNNLKMPDFPNVIPYSGSIHTAIKNAKGVFVINSGVGFEALMHKKPVFTAGNCDYKYVTTQIKDTSQIKSMRKLLDQSVDQDVLAKYMYYLINEVYVDTHDEKSIQRKIENVLRMSNG